MLDCTYLVQTLHQPGHLARVVSAIAQGEGLIGDVTTVSVGRSRSARSRSKLVTPSRRSGSRSSWMRLRTCACSGMRIAR